MRRGRKKALVDIGSSSPHLTNAAPPENQPSDNGGAQRRPRRRKSDLYSNIPRRASKRLAGVSVELASDGELRHTTRRASKRLAGISVEVGSQMVESNGLPQVEVVQSAPEATLQVGSTSGTEAFLVPEQFNQLESEKEGSFTVDSLTDKDSFKQKGYYVETQEQFSLGNKCEEPQKQGAHHLESEVVQLPPEATPQVGSTSGTEAYLVPEQFKQFEKEGSFTVDSLTDKDSFKQKGYYVETQEQFTIGQTKKFEEPQKQGAHHHESEENIPISEANKELEPPKEFISYVGAEEQNIGPENHQLSLDHAIPGNYETGTQADEKQENPLPSPLRDFWTDPCLQFAFKTLTGEIPVEMNMLPEIPVENRVGASASSAIPLSDPSFDFAYKTLTGEIPLEDFFQPAVNSTQTQSNIMGIAGREITLDDFYQMDKYFESGSLWKPSSPPKPVLGSESIVGNVDEVVQNLSSRVAGDTSGIVQHPGENENSDGKTRSHP